MQIKVIAPSACVDQSAIDVAKQNLNELDVNVKLSQHIFAQHRYLAGTANQKVSDLHDALNDPNTDAIWCARGGTGAAQMLPYLADVTINKPIIGYSDSTVLLNYIAMQGGTALHAPVFQEIALKNLTEAQLISLDAQEVLAKINPMLSHLPSHYPIQAYDHDANKNAVITGKILGGNLATLCSLQGTPWALTLKEDSILLLEDVGEPYYRLERLLIQLLQSIDTQYIKAVVLGDFYNCPQKNVPHSIEEIFSEHLKPHHIPLYCSTWFGHGEQNRPFWIGKLGHIQDQQLTI